MDQKDNAVGVINFDDHKMVPVAKDFFFEGMPLPVTIFLRMKPTQYLIIGRAGTKASFSHLHALNKDSTKVFVRDKDHSTLINFVTDLTSKVIAKKDMPASVKTKFLSSLALDSLKSFEGKNFANVEQLQKVSGLVVDLAKNVTAFDDTIKLLMDLPESDSKHALTTCFISIMILDEMELTHRPAQEKLALGALLHDVGLKFVPQEILKKPRHLWSPEDLKYYELHPIKSVEMLRDIKDISNDVLLIVAEHHENAAGTGYPKRLRDVKISPLSRIVGVADSFAELLFADREGSKNYSAQEAIIYIDDILGQPFNKQVFTALKNIVNKNHLKNKAG